MNTRMIICTVNVVTMRWVQLHRAAGKTVNAHKRDENNGNSSRPCAPICQGKTINDPCDELVLVHGATALCDSSCLHALHGSLSHDCAHDGLKTG